MSTIEAANKHSGIHISALKRRDAIGAEGTNQSCHGNEDGVDPNNKAIISHVRVMVLCWGRFYEDHPDALDNAYALCRDLVSGTYFNGLAQYGVGRGSVAGQARFDDTNPPKALSMNEARERIKGFVESLPLPERPAVDETSLLYVLFPPPQTKPTIFSGRDDFCGYHNSTKFHPESQNDDLFYALIRTDKAHQTSGSALINDVSACVSHEIAEAVTSRDGRGYHKGDCEIGDLCEQTGYHDYRGWNVEQYWSQWDRACVNGENPVSIRRFLQEVGVPGNLLALHTPVVNIEYIASGFR
ncbi:MAG TPA: hypothetical protein VMT20_22775 [Terriglobia bacterium]|nr:hypothetical protein [Terriglobia bacterium]